MEQVVSLMRQNGNSIEPNVTKAKIGDIVEWKFHSGEHWIIRGTLEQPCIPREYFYPEREKLSSGPMKVQGDSDEVYYLSGSFLGR